MCAQRLVMMEVPYEPIQEQPRTALFRPQPEIRQLLREYQETLRDLEGHPHAIPQLQALQAQEDRDFAAANEELESQFRLDTHTRNTHIKQGLTHSGAVP